MASVSASAANRSTSSSKARSAMSPIDSTAEKPRLRLCAQSSTPVARAPLCDRKASLPGMASIGANEALSPARGTRMPRQLGPIRRIFASAAAASISGLRPEASPSPAEMITASLVPLAPSSRSVSGTWAAGTAMTARSQSPAIAEMLGDHSAPGISIGLGLTAWITKRGACWPSFAAIRLARIAWPAGPSLREAPTRTTLRGANSAWAKAEIGIFQRYLAQQGTDGLEWL